MRFLFRSIFRFTARIAEREKYFLKKPALRAFCTRSKVSPQYSTARTAFRHLQYRAYRYTLGSNEMQIHSRTVRRPLARFVQRKKSTSPAPFF